jgi:hypothetical protein
MVTLAIIATKHLATDDILRNHNLIAHSHNAHLSRNRCARNAGLAVTVL